MKTLKFLCVALLAVVISACSSSNDNKSNEEGAAAVTFDETKAKALEEKIYAAEGPEDLTDQDYAEMLDQYLAICKEVSKEFNKCNSMDDLQKVIQNERVMTLEKYSNIFGSVLEQAEAEGALSSKNEKRYEEVEAEWEQFNQNMQEKVSKFI